MSMPERTLQELAEEVVRASTNGDADVLLQCAVALDVIGTPDASAFAARARGTVHLLHSDTAAAVECFRSALAWYEECGNQAARAAILDYLGRAHTDAGDFESGLSYFEEALAIAKELHPRSHAATLTGNIGSVLFNQHRYAEALEYLNRATAYHEELGEKIGVAATTTNIGAVYGDMGKFPEALMYFHRALAVYEEVGNKQMVATLLMNVGLVHGSTGDEVNALDCFTRGMSLYEELGDRRGVARSLNKMGTSYAALGDHDQALSCHHRALAIFTEIGSGLGIAHVTGDIITAYIETGHDEKALPFLEQMDAMTDLNAISTLRLATNRARIHSNRGEYDEARATLRQALELAHTLQIHPVEADVHLRLRDLSQQTNDFAGYLQHNAEYTRISEEINGKDTAVRLAVQEAERKMALERAEYEKHLTILHSALPKHVADRVARGEEVNDSFDHAAVLFLDVVGFTTNSSTLEAATVVVLLQSIFTSFDKVCDEHDVMKIKTIGDSYMAVAFETPAGLPERRAADVARAMMSLTFTWPHNNQRVMFRIGLHSGPVVAGVLGSSRLQYDVWGDTVNVASRMESTSEPGRIHVSEAFATALQSVDSGHWTVDDLNDSMTNDSMTLFKRGEVSVKGKGPMTTYWLERA